jgi:hypothetical protein
MTEEKQQQRRRVSAETFRLLDPVIRTLVGAALYTGCGEPRPTAFLEIR